MEVIPAIDLLGGQCVRLVQGRYDRVIPYKSDPLVVAEQFCAAGARALHIIDLDGARNGRLENVSVLARIVAKTGVHVQFGGGVRDEAAIQAALDAGAARVIIGTRAIEDPDWFREMVHRPAYVGRLALGLDARVGRLATHGWTCNLEQAATDVARTVAQWPLAAIVYTDIGRDGLLLGPNLHAIEKLAALSAVPIIAAGGVSNLDDVRHLAQVRLAGVVIGRALYEGAIDLKAALEIAAHRTDQPTS